MTRTLKHLSDAFGPGDRVFVHAMTGESALLADELRDDPERARGVEFVGVQFPGIDSIDYLAVHPEARLTAFFMSPQARRGLQAGRTTLMSGEYGDIAHVLQHGPAVDVAVAQVSPPDADGHCSLGFSSDFLPLAWARARKRIAHINPALPRTRGSFTVALASLDGVVDAERPLLQYTNPAFGEIDLQIARNAAGMIRDGDTLQFGIGTVPLALSRVLTQHRRLKLHAGMVTQGFRELSLAGALDDAARVTTGVALGDSAFHDFVARHDRVWFTDVTHTHDVEAIARTPRFVAVNSAVEVDLFGQVNSERTGGQLQAGAGGLPRFAQGALRSEGGRLLICLRATAAKGTLSRIVPSLTAQGLCTLPRYLADAVITEHGVAQLRGQSLDARAEALIGIAAPEHRTALADAWAQQLAKI